MCIARKQFLGHFKNAGGRIDDVYLAKVKELDYLTISNEL